MTNNASAFQPVSGSEEITPHTPGPWSVCGDGKCSCKTVSCGDFPIAKITVGPWGDDYPSIRLVGESSLQLKAEPFMEQCTYGEVSEPMARANALLIASAPDMLAVLKALVHPDNHALVYFVPSDAWAQKLLADVHAAIAKAEGHPLSSTNSTTPGD